MIIIHDKFDKKYRLKFEKKSKEISVYLYDIGDVVEMDKGAEVFWKKQGYEITPCNVGPVRFTIIKII